MLVLLFVALWLRAYAASQTTVLHMKRLNQTDSPIFVILCVLCFQRQIFFTFILFYEAICFKSCLAYCIFVQSFEHCDYLARGIES